MILRHFTIPKINENIDSNQDFIGYDEKQKIFAIADGVTTSSYPEIWSEVIVNHFLNNPFKELQLSRDFLKTWVDSAIETFNTKISGLEIDEFITDLIKDNGAETTFLGLKIIDELKSKKIRVWAIGDSNIFHIKKNKLENLFPITKTNDFTNFTSVFTTLSEKNQFELISKEWSVSQGDVIIISTDAFSKWFLWATSCGQKPWKKIQKNFSRMNKFVESLRFNDKINDDDTSFIFLKI